MSVSKLDRREFLSGALAAAAVATLPGRASAQAAKGPSKIDFHVHLGRTRQEMFQMSGDKVSGAVKHLLGEMDRHNVEKALIVAVEPVFPTELYLQAVKLEPARLMAACSVFPRPANEALDKLRSYRDRGAKALKLQPMQYDPRDPAVDALIAEAVRLDMPVLFHHTDTPKSFPESLAHWASTFPKGTFVVIHFGGVYGFWDVLPLVRMPNVYLETSTAFPRIVKSPLRSMLHFLAEENRLDKLVFGSEHASDYDTVSAAIDDLLGPSAKPEVARAIYRGNAEKLLKLTVSSRVQSDETERERNQKVPEIFSAMGVKEGSRVSELGAGGGFFVVRLARAVGAGGRVFAVDISESEIKQLRQRLQEDSIENVEVIQGEADDPKLPAASLDATLIADTYHEMTKYEAMLVRIRQALKPGGRLVIVDRVRASTRKEGSKRTRDQQTSGHEIAPELVEQELRQAGYEIVERRDPFTERNAGELINWLIVARRPG